MTEKLPKVLAISGSDILSGGGFQADLATYSQYGIYGFVAITSIVTTTQDGEGFVITATDLSLFQQQLDSLADVAFDAIKIGLLPSVEIAELTLAFIKQHQEIPIILDPVLVFKENDDHEITKMKATLLAFLPYVTVITPNLREAAILTGMPIDTPADMETAAIRLCHLGSQHTIIKGGNRMDQSLARDLYYDGQIVKIFVKPLVSNNNNGAGCTFASAIASNLAISTPMVAAIEQSKAFTYQAILSSNEYGVFQHDIND